MTEGAQINLDGEMAKVQKQFDQLRERLKVESEKQSAIQRNINTITEELVRLQGEYRVLERMKGNGQPEKKEPALTIPSKKEKKK